MSARSCGAVDLDRQLAPGAEGEPDSRSRPANGLGRVALASVSALPDLLALDDGLLQLFGTGLAQTLEDPEFFYEGGA